jgi:hypothetical protein
MPHVPLMLTRLSPMPMPAPVNRRPAASELKFGRPQNISRLIHTMRLAREAKPLFPQELESEDHPRGPGTRLAFDVLPAGPAL